jgi:hypothetical protein
MNRIIIVGNGFDLAHGVKTSYKDFIEWYFGKVVEKLKRDYSYKDELLEVRLQRTYHNSFELPDYLDLDSPKEILQNIKKDGYIFECLPFLRRIISGIENKGWVDIEADYYELLKDYALNKRGDVKQLNEELSYIEKKLIEYLKIEQDKFDEFYIEEDLQDIIYEPFSYISVSLKGKKCLDEHIEQDCKDKENDNLRIKLENYGYDIKKVSDYIDYLFNKSKELNKSISNFIRTECFFKGDKFPKELLLPNSIMLLNFNYTKIADKYMTRYFQLLNHIHGELNDENSVIFGYGDELDNKYKEIEELNNNEFLNKIKSVKYLERDKYRKLLYFLELEPFQVYVMGHSCGNSDRTLLNTIFEHENCVSIKLFYHKKSDGTDNFTEIVQNITRNFNDKKLLRSIVVDKTCCEPMPQSKFGQDLK